MPYRLVHRMQRSHDAGSDPTEIAVFQAIVALFQ